MIGGIAATACADAAGYLLPAIIAGRRLVIAGDWARDAERGGLRRPCCGLVSAPYIRLCRFA
jgi:hypothetical protein